MPLLDAPLGTTDESLLRKWTMSYESMIPQEFTVEVNGIPVNSKPRKVVYYAAGRALNTTICGVRHDIGCYREIIQIRNGLVDNYDENYPSEIKEYYYTPTSSEQAIESGRLHFHKFPNGKMYVYSYSNENGFFTENILFTSILNPAGIPGKSSKKTTIKNTRGNIISQSEYAMLADSSWVLLNADTFEYDQLDNLIKSKRNGIEYYIATYSGKNKLYEKKPNGVEFTYTYDGFGNVVSAVESGVGNIPALTSIYEHDGLARITKITTNDIKSRAFSYNPLGQITYFKDENGLTYNYSYSNGGNVKTSTYPNGAVNIETHYNDAFLASSVGGNSPSSFVNISVGDDGSLQKTTRYLSNDGGRWNQVVSNGLGKVVSATQACSCGTGISKKEFIYNDKGYLVKRKTPGIADTLYTYDEVGNIEYEALDLNENGIIDTNLDYVKKHDINYVLVGNAVHREVSSYVYQDSQWKLLFKRRAKISGYTNPIDSYEELEDANGNITSTSFVANRQNNIQTRVTTYPNSISSKTETYNGMTLVSVLNSPSNFGITYSYDSLRRPTEIKLSNHTNSSLVTYIGGGNLVSSSKDAAGNETLFEYYPNNGLGAGLLKKKTNPLGSTSVYEYNAFGSITKISGTAEYPVEFVYDDYGQKIQMRTFREDMTSPDITTWSYSEQTGLLMSKTDALGKSVSFTYNDAGKVATKTLARLTAEGEPLTISYAYNNAGNLLYIDYSDTTPDIAYTYDILGRILSVSDITGTRTFAYDPISLKKISESLSGFYGARTITTTYDNYMRFSGLKFGIADTSEYSAEYEYAEYSRISKVKHGSDAFEYFYKPNSNLLSSIRNGLYSCNIEYEENRDLKVLVSNKFDEETKATYAYAYDSLNRRTYRIENSILMDTSYTLDYTYNSRNEMLSAVQRENVDQFLYAYYTYDNIGNRKRIEQNSVGMDTPTNAANQYTDIEYYMDNIQYDDDGNMLGSATGNLAAQYYYDAENRLIKAVKNGKRYEFTYDFLGRKIERKKFNDLTSTTPISHERYMYDSFNELAAFKVSTTSAGVETLAPKTHYIWGVDLSGGLKKGAGAGGMVKLVEFANSPQNYYPMYDSQGNLTDILGTNGEVSAHYLYSSSGYTYNYGSFSNQNKYRFSTRSYDDDLMLYYYTYRHYSLHTGRWLSRDPLGEAGGINLYTFLLNDPVNYVDFMGDIRFASNGAGGSIIFDGVNSSIADNIGSGGIGATASLWGDLSMWGDALIDTMLPVEPTSPSPSISNPTSPNCCGVAPSTNIGDYIDAKVTCDLTFKMNNQGDYVSELETNLYNEDYFSLKTKFNNDSYYDINLSLKNSADPLGLNPNFNIDSNSISVNVSKNFEPFSVSGEVEYNNNDSSVSVTAGASYKVNDNILLNANVNIRKSNQDLGTNFTITIISK